MFTAWEVFRDEETKDHRGAWVLKLTADPFIEFPVHAQPTFQGVKMPMVLTLLPMSRFVNVCPDRWPWELAVDAALEFMDRLRTGAIPKGVDCPDELMSMCFRNARNQR